MSRQIVNAKTVAAKGRTHKVTQVNDWTYEVESGASGNVYTVKVLGNGASCDCRWGRAGGVIPPLKWAESGCSHVQAVMQYIAEREGRRASSWATQTDAKRQHRPTKYIGQGVWMTTRKVGA